MSNIASVFSVNYASVPLKYRSQTELKNLGFQIKLISKETETRHKCRHLYKLIYLHDWRCHVLNIKTNKITLMTGLAGNKFKG